MNLAPHEPFSFYSLSPQLGSFPASFPTSLPRFLQARIDLIVG